MRTETEVRTAAEPARIVLVPDRKAIRADGMDLSFVTVKVVDKDGTLVPAADNLIKFKVTGEGSIVGVDNGNQISHKGSPFGRIPPSGPVPRAGP